MDDDRKLNVAFNSNLIDKNVAGDPDLYATGWLNTGATLSEMAEGVRLGWAFCPHMSGSRSTKNFLASDVAPVDIDDTPSIEAVLEHPLVKEHAGLVYTTVSCTPEAPRLRVVFVLSRTITKADEMKAINRALSLRLCGDPAATDAARISFGCRDATIFMIGREIPESLQDELIAQGQSITTAKPSDGSPSARSKLRMPDDMLVRVAGGGTQALSEAKPKTRVHCPYHADDNPSAFVVVSKQGVKGVHCSTCAQTFWPKSAQDGFDFNDFDRVAQEAKAYYDKHQDWGAFNPLLNPEAIEGLQACNITIVEGRPAPPRLLPGITCVISPKGSGKTTSLISLLSDVPSVLLIGHRRALIEQICVKLGLTYYLDTDREMGRIKEPRLGVCLDSLHKVAQMVRYDVVVLDESEQLLSHFLSDPLEQGAGRERLFVEFRERICRAKSVIALDADLGWITFTTLTRMVAVKEAA